MDGAVAALKKGLGAAMLQTGTADFLRNLVRHSPAVRDDERDTLLSFLDSSSSAGTEGSDQIVGIVQQMKETLQGDLDEAVSNEQQAKASFETLSTTKAEEIATAGKAIEAKADLKTTETALEDDTKFKAELAASCATKQEEW